jgi:hypothetical protein
VLRWLARMFQSPRDAAEKQQGDVRALDRSDDPRGGIQSDDTVTRNRWRSSRTQVSRWAGRAGRLATS